MQKSTRYLLAINAMLFRGRSDVVQRLLPRAIRLISDEGQMDIFYRQFCSLCDLLYWQKQKRKGEK
jgi:hypothetical protein